MNEVKTIEGITNVYDSKEMKGFDLPENYPIAWEVIFINDKAGKEFAGNIRKAFSELPPEKGYIVDFEGEPSDVARCVECVFADKHSFRKVLNEALPEMVIYDERAKGIVPKQKMIDEAGKITQKEMAIAY